MNVGEANAVNVLAQYLGAAAKRDAPPLFVNVRNALMLLARGARKTLGAGVGAEDVKRWGEQPPGDPGALRLMFAVVRDGEQLHPMDAQWAAIDVDESGDVQLLRVFGKVREAVAREMERAR